MVNDVMKVQFEGLVVRSPSAKPGCSSCDNEDQAEAHHGDDHTTNGSDSSVHGSDKENVTLETERSVVDGALVEEFGS